MCKEILPNLFRLKIPLPESPLKYLNSYVIRDAHRSMIIDTGLNRQECLEAMMAGLHKVGIDLEKSDIFITHLQVDLILPGHRRLIRNQDARIAELKQHHAQRLDEVLTILEGAPLNAFQVAARMTWDIKADSWDQFPVAQRWFATGEAISHLRYLEEEGKLARKKSGKIQLYSLVQ